MIWLSGLLLMAACQPSVPERLRVVAGQAIELQWSGPPGFMLNEAAPSSVRLLGPSLSNQWETPDLKRGQLSIVIPPGTPPGELALEGRIYLCQKTDARVCIQSQKTTRIEVEQRDGAPADGGASDRAVKLDWRLKPGKN